MSRLGTAWDDHVFPQGSADELTRNFSSADTNARAKPVRASAGKRQYDPYLENTDTVPVRSVLLYNQIFELSAKLIEFTQ